MRAFRSKARAEQKRQKRKKVFIILPLIIFILCGGFIYYAFSLSFHINNITVSGTSFIDDDLINGSVQEILNMKFWGVVPKQSPLLISAKSIEQMLAVKYPPIKDVQVTVKDGTLTVEIQERDPVAVLCTGGNVCYFIDEIGTAFIEAPQFEGSSFVKIDTYESSIDIGKAVLGKSELQHIKALIQSFESLSLPIQKVVLKSETDIDLIGPGETAFIVRRYEDTTTIIERLQTLLTSRPDIKEGKYEYVDLRIESKVFLKSRES